MKKLIYVLIPLLLLTCLTFTGIKADDSTVLYVSASGSDTNDGSTEENSLATLNKAAEIVNNDSDGKKFVIYVTSDLTMTKSARFFDHDVTITGMGDKAPVVTRGDNFETISDNARGWYNPAMFELQTTKEEGTVALKFTNIVLDDNFKHQGSVFAQANSSTGSDNTVYVQDGIVSSNAIIPATITLGDKTTLRNFGGMSAVRVTSKATLIMESGSVIEDSSAYTRTKGKASDEVGVAGAIWSQSGIVIINEGAKIQNINGRAIYADGGNVTVSGSILNITPNKNIWNSNEGIALHLRNNAEATLTSTALLDNSGVTGVDASSFVIVNGGSKLTADNGSVIKKLDKMTAIKVVSDAVVEFDGEITGMTNGGNAMNIQEDGFEVTVGKNANIHGNTVWYGALYIQGDGKVYHYGKINNNVSTDRSGGVCLAQNKKPSTFYMYDGAEICGNYSVETGGGLMVSKGTFYMLGGTISNNIAAHEGGGVYVRNGGKFEMSGGTISNNATAKFGGGVAYLCKNFGGEDSYAIIDGGSITDNYMNVTIVKNDDGTYSYERNDATKSNDVAIAKGGDYCYTARCLKINDSSVLGNKEIYFEQDNKTVTAVNNSEPNVWLGNANSAVVTQLETVSKAKGWSSNIASFYVYRGAESCELKISGVNFNDKLPVFALVVKGVDKDGNTETGASVQAYNTVIDGKDIYLNIPASGDENTLGYEVILVQPTSDFGNVIITGPSVLKQDLSATEYTVEYTATYTMSESFKNMIDQMKDRVSDDNCKFTFVVELDSRLTAEFVSFESPIFTADTSNVKVDGNKITVTCNLKSDWKEHISELVDTPMVLKGNGILKAEDFAQGDILNTTGHIEVVLPTNTIYLPANVVNTLEVGSYGNLTITKMLKGDIKDGMDLTFDFEVKVNDETISGQYGDLEFENGVAKFTLDGRGSVTASNLPSGLEYTVKELSENKNDFVTTYENEKGIIKDDETINVFITNTYSPKTDNVPDTGDHSHLYIWIGVMAVSAVAIGWVVVSKKKHSR